MSITDNHRNIINEYADRIKTAYTESEQRDIAVALLAHVAYLLGRESLRQEGDRNEGIEHI